MQEVKKKCGRQWDFKTKLGWWKLHSFETQIDAQACNASSALYEPNIKKGNFYICKNVVS